MYLRLSLLVRLVLKEQTTILAIVVAGSERAQSWMHAVRAHLAFLVGFGEPFSGCKDYAFKDWIVLVGKNPKWFLREVHKVLLLPVAILYMMPDDALRCNDGDDD
eukprot:11982559-Karenia_brevis.AAC.1